MTAIRNYNNLSFEEIEEYLEPVILPSSLPEQTCLRCGNFFPGGLKRCTACGLEVAQAYQEPEAALPWRGYERGVIECNSCGFETPDHIARKNKIQKCGQCGKVVYIPSGLYSKQQHTQVRYKYDSSNPFYVLSDLLGAGFSRLFRGKLRLVTIGVLMLLIAAGIAFIVNGRQQQTAVPVVDPPIKVYYNTVVAIHNRVGNALTEFNNDAGGLPLQSEFDDRRNPAKRTRFVYACKRALGVIESSIEEMRSIAYVPPAAENYQTKMLAMLYSQQRFYAQLKDSIEEGASPRSDADRKTLWDNAFKLKEDIRLASRDEIEALNNLQTLALRPIKDNNNP